MMLDTFFKGVKALATGHTGFKRSRQCLRPVRELAERYVSHRGKEEVCLEGAASGKQGWPSYLVNDKARLLLGWAQVWDFEHTVAETASWHACEAEGGSLVDFSRAQVASHMAGAVE